MAELDPKLAERLEALEIRAAFQENSLAELDAAIIRQQAILDSLHAEISTLGERLRALSSQLSEVSDDDTPPPHY